MLLGSAALRWSARLSGRSVCLGNVLAPRRAFVACTRALREKYTMTLPGLGDSITEGTIIRWEKDVGQVVDVDEVVAVVETDKVSIDIRSQNRGVLLEQHAAVDQNIEVGAPLCSLDLDAAPKKEPIEIPTQDPTPPPPPEDDAGYAAFSSGAVFKEPPRKHIPLIKFIGKRDHAKLTKAKLPLPKGQWAHSPGALDIRQIVGGTQFGKPPMTDDEMEAILSGGATAAPVGNLKNRWASN